MPIWYAERTMKSAEVMQAKDFDRNNAWSPPFNDRILSQDPNAFKERGYRPPLTPCPALRSAQPPPLRGVCQNE